jgi:hypothetical protein
VNLRIGSGHMPQVIWAGPGNHGYRTGA